MTMKVSNVGLTLIKKWEGFYKDAYQGKADKPGLITIGYGTTKWEDGRAVKLGDKITLEKATTLLEKQVNEHAMNMFKYIKITLSQNQFDALASFHYNLGANILAKDTALAKYINAKDWTNTTRVMMLYTKANGVTQNGLVNRRIEEIVLFLKEEELIFSNAALKITIDSLLSNKTKQSEIVQKAAKNGIIDKSWIEKFKKDEQAIHDIIGICVKYALLK